MARMSDGAFHTLDDAGFLSLIAAMSPDEKVDLLNGAGLWRSRGNERLGVPSIVMTDGAYGVRYSTSRSTRGRIRTRAWRSFWRW